MAGSFAAVFIGTRRASARSNASSTEAFSAKTVAKKLKGTRQEQKHMKHRKTRVGALEHGEGAWDT